MLEPEQLFLLEFLVDSVYIHRLCGKEINNRDWLLCGQTVVSFQFLNFQAQAISDSDFPNPECPGSGPQKFESGKSCLFSIPEKELLRAPGQFVVNIAVYKRQPAGILPECVQVGEAKIDITNEFTAVVCDALRNPKETPASNAIKDTFIVHTPGSHEPVGMIRLFLRLSCFGKSIVTEFSLGNGENYLFKGTEDSLYRCQQIKRDLAAPPGCSVQTDVCPAKGGAGGWPMFPDPTSAFGSSVCPGMMGSGASPVCPASGPPPCQPLVTPPCPTQPPPPPQGPMGMGSPPCPAPCGAPRPVCPTQFPTGGGAPSSANVQTDDQIPNGSASLSVSGTSRKKSKSRSSRESSIRKSSAFSDPRKSSKGFKSQVTTTTSIRPLSTMGPEKSIKGFKSQMSTIRPQSTIGPEKSLKGNSSVAGMKLQKFSKDQSKSKAVPPNSLCQEIDLPLESRYPELEPQALQDVLQMVIQDAMKDDPNALQEGEEGESGDCAQPSDLQKPTIMAWRQRIRGKIVPPCVDYAKAQSVDSQQPASSLQSQGIQFHPESEQPLKIQQEPYRYVPAYVDLAGFLFPDLFWALIDYFLDNEEWLPFEQLNPFFKVICRQFRVSGETLLDAPGFAPLWVGVLRGADAAAFRTVVQHFFSARRLPPWRCLPAYLLDAFAQAGVAEFQYKQPFDPFAHLHADAQETTST